MNDKKAKALRRAAEQATVGQPRVVYVATRQRQREVTGAGKQPVLLRTDTQQLDARCTRATYQRLKKEA